MLFILFFKNFPVINKNGVNYVNLFSNEMGQAQVTLQRQIIKTKLNDKTIKQRTLNSVVSGDGEDERKDSLCTPHGGAAVHH